MGHNPPHALQYKMLRRPFAQGGLQWVFSGLSHQKLAARMEA